MICPTLISHTSSPEEKKRRFPAKPFLVHFVHLPIPDAAHVRNALARLDQTDISPEAKKAALRKIKTAAKKFGIKVSASTNAIDYSELY